MAAVRKHRLKQYICVCHRDVQVCFVFTDRPGMFDQKGRAKWDHWSEQKGVHAPQRVNCAEYTLHTVWHAVVTFLHRFCSALVA